LECFLKHKLLLPYEFTESHLQKLLNWTLDYNFIEYKGEYFKQHFGIPMGSNASVSVSNITVSKEIQHMFLNKSEIVFRCRFIDDIFMLIDVTDTIVEVYLKNFFVHDIFTFTYEYNNKSINFLDIKVEILDKVIHTSTYRKPMNKHLPLHFLSNHPEHLLKSLPYSAGIRIIRNSSDRYIATENIKEELVKFSSRGYPSIILEECYTKLSLILRHEVLKPKKALLLNSLRIHNPEILSQFNISMEEYVTQTGICKDKVFIVVPFYKNVFKLSQIVKETLLDSLKLNNISEYEHLTKSLKVSIAYKNTNRLTNLLVKQEK